MQRKQSYYRMFCAYLNTFSRMGLKAAAAAKFAAPCRSASSKDPSAPHRVHQVVRHVDAAHGGVQARPVEHIPLDDIARRMPVRQHGGPAGQAAHPVATSLERGQQPATDVAGGAGQEDQGGHGVCLV